MTVYRHRTQQKSRSLRAAAEEDPSPVRASSELRVQNSCTLLQDELAQTQAMPFFSV